jgi:hypothetical protein
VKRSTLILSLFFLLVLVPFIQAETRTALVIGNGEYAISPLKNPPNDAIDISRKLQNLDFEVTTLINANGLEMERSIREFGKDLAKDENGLGLFYYAGHGVQIEGRNYLVPIGADINAADEVRYKAIDAGIVLSKMESAGNGTNIVLLDACRDNPYKSSFRTQNRGLAIVNAPRGSLIVYATSPGDVAQDGEGRNGVFTGSLLKYIETPGVDVELMLRQVRREVMHRTGNRQTPWTTSSLTGSLYLAGEEGEGFEGFETFPEPAESAQETDQDILCELFISTDPMGAEITVNGEAKGVSPQLINNIPLYSEVKIEAELGNSFGEKTVLINNPGLNDVTITLEQERGNLFIKADKTEVTAYIDGKRIGEYGNGLFTDLPTGEHTVELKGANLFWEGNVTIIANKTTSIVVEVQEDIYSINDTGEGGGIVFFDKGNYSDGWRYLEAAQDNLEKGTWNDAKQACKTLQANGVKDWYLPSKQELDYLYENLFKQNLGDFKEGYYWSSTEHDSENAWLHDFNSGEQFPVSKGYPAEVCAIRSF